MLASVILWIVIIGISFVIGSGILNLTNVSCFNRGGDRFIIAIWLGICILSITFLCVSLLQPLKPATSLITVIALVGISLVFRKNRHSISQYMAQISPRWVLVFLTLSFGIATVTSKQVKWFDTGLYHYQVIKWLSEVGAVSGLALIHNRFSFTSSWFALHAPLNFGILENRVGGLLGGLVVLLILLQFLISLVYISTHQSRVEDWLMAFSPFLYVFIALDSGLAISPSPDMTIAVLPLVLGWSILIVSRDSELETGHKTALDSPKKGLKKLNPILNAHLIPLLLGAGAVTMKLSGLPLLMVGFCFFTIRPKFQWKRFFVGILISFLLILPMLLFSVVTSGCPLYPSSLMCLDLPWSVGKESAQVMSDVIQNWARWTGPTPEYANSWNWLGRWIITEKQASFLIITSFISTLFIFFLPNSYRHQQQYWLLAIGLSGIAFMFYGAPSLRFGIGYLCILPSTLLALIAVQRPAFAHACLIIVTFVLHSLLSKRFYISIFTILLLISCIYFTNWFNRKGSMIGVSFVIAIAFYATNLFDFSKTAHARSDQLPLVLPEAVEVHTNKELIRQRAGNFRYFIPIKEKEDSCWASRLVCTPYPIPNEIRLRDKEVGIKSGFFRKQPEQP